MSGWAEIEAAIDSSSLTVEVRPALRSEETLSRLGVRSDSPLGAVVSSTGGVLVDDGWIRIPGGGSDAFPCAGEWPGENVPCPLDTSDSWFVAAWDAVGGFFIALAETRSVWAFTPDLLEWQDTELGYGAFVHWTIGGGIDVLYGALRWEGWRDEVAPLPPDRGMLLYPPPFTDEGRDPARVARAAVPLQELWDFYPGGGAQQAMS